MEVILNGLKRIKREQRGVTALEYGLIAAVVGGAVIGAATSLGNNITTAFSSLGERMYYVAYMMTHT